MLLAVVLALLDPCLADGRDLSRDGCAAARGLTPALALATVGTTLAVVGGAAATVLTLRRRPGSRDDAPSEEP